MSQPRLPALDAIQGTSNREQSLQNSEGWVLFCLIEGEGQNDIFSLRVPASRTVDNLKKVIYAQGIGNAGFRAKHLTLFKVNIDLDGCIEDSLKKISQNGDETQLRLLLPWKTLSFYWPSQPESNKLNVFVKLPASDTGAKKRSPGLQASENKRMRLDATSYRDNFANTLGEASSSDTSDAASGAGPHSSLQTTDDAINQARTWLNSISDALKLVATTDFRLNSSNPFFVDGLGAVYHTDQALKGRVDDLFGSEKYRIVSNTPGSGKTRLLVEGLCQYWGLYFTPDLAPHLGSSDFHSSINSIGSSTHAGKAFTQDLPKSPVRRSAALSNNMIIAQNAFLSIVLARLLVLEAFLQVGAGIPAVDLRRRWTYLQLVPSALNPQISGPSEDDIFSSVYKTIKGHGNCDHRLTNSLLANIRTDTRVSSTPIFHLILDDAHKLTDQYSGAFHSMRDVTPAGRRSVLREAYVSWELHLEDTRVIFSGTGLSLNKILNPVTRIAELDNTDESVFIDVGAFVSQKAQRDYIEQHVTLDENTKEEVLRRAWQWLRGRHQFTGGFVHLLRHFGTSDALTLLNSYIYSLSGYAPMGHFNFVMMDQQIKLLSIVEQVKKLDENTYLRERVANAITIFMLRNKLQRLDYSDADAVALGIARYRTAGEAGGREIILDEPLVIASLLKYLENSLDSMEEKLCQRLSNVSDDALQGHTMEDIAMYTIARQLDGTRSLRQIFDLKTVSIDIGQGKAQLIVIDGINPGGTFRYSIVDEPWLYPFGMGFDAKTPSEHSEWFKGTAIPFCFPDKMSGHDLEFFVLVEGRVVFVMVQFKFYNKHHDEATTEQALTAISLPGSYKSEDGKIYGPRQEILSILQGSNTPCLGVLASFPSKPHIQTIDELAREGFALFDFLRIEGKLGRIICRLKQDQFPNL